MTDPNPLDKLLNQVFVSQPKTTTTDLLSAPNPQAASWAAEHGDVPSIGRVEPPAEAPTEPEDEDPSQIWNVYDYTIWRTCVRLDKDGDEGYFKCLTTGKLFWANRKFAKRGG